MTFRPGRTYANMCSPMVVCVLLSRFALIAALGERRALAGRDGGSAGRGARIGAGPSRFSSFAAALRARPRRAAEVISAGAVRAFLAPLPVRLLRSRPELAGLPETLERLGIRTLGE